MTAEKLPDDFAIMDLLTLCQNRLLTFVPGTLFLHTKALSRTRYPLTEFLQVAAGGESFLPLRIFRLGHLSYLAG